MAAEFSPISLVVPLDPAFRSLAPDVATRYAELAGGSTADARTVGAAVLAALERLAAGAAVGAHVDLAFRSEGGGVHVDLSCTGRHETVDVTIPVAKR